MPRIRSQFLWHLVRAELAYNALTLVALLLVLTFTYFLFGNLARNNLYNDPTIPHVLTISIMYLLYLNRFMEKRARLFQIAAVSAQEIAVARLLAPSIYWLGAIVLYGSTQFAAGETLYGWWPVLTLSSLILMANAAFCLSFDMWSAGQDEAAKALFISLLWMGVMAFALLYINSFMYDLLQQRQTGLARFVYTTPAGVAVQHAVALGLSYISYAYYINRNSYVN